MLPRAISLIYMLMSPDFGFTSDATRFWGLAIAEHLPNDPSSGDSVPLVERLRGAVRVP